ncbi:rhomboid family intramembrane serine protease, partial [Myxococcota bacterium]|nr:rhomboid family intramembrane serine protease [Myxococcota bacterium]
IGLRGKGKKQSLLIGTKKKLFLYKLSAFVNERTPYELRTHLQSAILSLPEGPSLWQKLLDRERSAAQAMALKPLATYVLLGSIGIIFFVEMALGFEESPFALVDLGANAPSLVRAGQWYRLVTANFLHGGLLHLYMNGIALWSLGALLERLMGSKRFGVVYLAAALGGSIASTLSAQAAYSVGASTALFGLVGSLAILNWRFYGELPTGFRQPLRWWIFVLGINAALPALVPQIDIAAHIGGFVLGAAVTFVMYMPMKKLDVLLKPRRPVTIALAIFGGIFMLGFIQGTVRAIAPPDEDRMRVAEHYADAPFAKASGLNQIAWDFVTVSKISERKLRLAKKMAERAVKEGEVDAAFLDTLATAYYRLGEWDDAIATERKAISYGRNDFRYTQLYRFLRAREVEQGPLLIGDA